jgi:hypothetical protein
MPGGLGDGGSGYEIVPEGSVRRSVIQLGRKCNFDEAHARKVTEANIDRGMGYKYSIG